MVDQPISALDTATLADTDLLAVVSGGATKKCTVTALGVAFPDIDTGLLSLTNSDEADTHNREITMGGDSNARTITTATSKWGAVVHRQYLNTDTPFCMIAGGGTATASTMWVGGGAGGSACCTLLRFSVSSTVGATFASTDERMRLSTVGLRIEPSGLSGAPGWLLDCVADGNDDALIVDNTSGCMATGTSINTNYQANVGGRLSVRNDTSGNHTIVMGGDSNATTRTTATTKYGLLVAPHYTNTEENCMAVMIASTATTTTCYVGGGTADTNAATRVSFYAAATTITTTGTEVGRITSTGMRLGGSGNPDSSAILELQSTTQSFLPPRMTSTQITTITTPAEGSLVYNTTTNRLNFHNGTTWSVVSIV